MFKSLISDKRLTGHILALITITVWGSTFITTKMLLSELTPVQIMLCRFAIAYVVLWLIRPKFDKTTAKDELLFLAMGVFGWLPNTFSNMLHTFSKIKKQNKKLLGIPYVMVDAW